jgi:hypothetical protein
LPVVGAIRCQLLIALGSSGQAANANAHVALDDTSSQCD